METLQKAKADVQAQLDAELFKKVGTITYYGEVGQGKTGGAGTSGIPIQNIPVPKKQKNKITSIADMYNQTVGGLVKPKKKALAETQGAAPVEYELGEDPSPGCSTGGHDECQSNKANPCGAEDGNCSVCDESQSCTCSCHKE